VRCSPRDRFVDLLATGHPACEFPGRSASAR
jgi:hypothetical protein